MTKTKLHAASRLKLDKFLDKGSLPSIPQVLFKIREVTEDPKSGIADLANVILTDHQLTTRILRMANSAYYGEYAGKVTRVTQAVTLMGFRSVRNAALALAIYSAVERLSKCPGFDFPAFWTRSIGVGVIAKQLALSTGLRSAEEAFIAGFLHNIGQPLLAAVFPQKYDELLKKDPSPSALAEFEDEAIGINHLAAGGWLARKWKLPKKLIAPIEQYDRHSHDNNEPASERLVDYIYIASRLYSHVMIRNVDHGGTLTAIRSEAVRLLGAKPESIDALVEDGRALIVEIASELNMQISEGAQENPLESVAILNSRLALRELQLSIIQGATESLLKVESDEGALSIVLDGAYRGLELGSLVFFKKSEDSNSSEETDNSEETIEYIGMLGYGRINPERDQLAIKHSELTTELFEKLTSGNIYMGNSLSKAVAGVPNESDLNTIGNDAEGTEEIDPDATVYMVRNDKFVAIPLQVEGELKYIALATPHAGKDNVDEQKLRTLSSLCSQVSITLERLELRRQLAQHTLQRINVTPLT